MTRIVFKKNSEGTKLIEERKPFQQSYNNNNNNNNNIIWLQNVGRCLKKTSMLYYIQNNSCYNDIIKSLLKNKMYLYIYCKFKN